MSQRRHAVLWANALSLVLTPIACTGDADQLFVEPEAGAMLDGSTRDGGAGGSGAGGAGASTPDTGSGGAGGQGMVVVPPANGCDALTVAPASVDGKSSDRVTWFDGACKQRTAALVRNDGNDGGYLRLLTYDHGGKTRECRGTGANGWNGAGYVVSHYSSSATGSHGLAGKWKTLLGGKHHAIHEFKWRIDPGAGVDVTVHWFFATGRSHPVYSITYDSSPAGSADKVQADARSPYSDMSFEGVTDGIAEGIGWGDKYKLRSTGTGPVKKASGGYDYAFDYAQKNLVPHTLMWSSTQDAEMGYVQTQLFDQKAGGGDYAQGGTDLTQYWGKTGKSMPVDWSWPFQLNQYELPYGSGSHRLAWGANYGAVGMASYTTFGRKESGYPYQSYAVFMVFGEHSAQAVDTQVAEIEALQSVKLTASKGAVSTQGSGGVGRTDNVAYSPAGYNHVYSVWDVVADNNTVRLAFDTGGKSLRNPVFLVRHYTAASAPSKVTLGGQQLADGSGSFATVDADHQQLWITLGATVQGNVDIAIE